MKKFIYTFGVLICASIVLKFAEMNIKSDGSRSVEIIISDYDGDKRFSIQKKIDLPPAIKINDPVSGYSLGAYNWCMSGNISDGGVIFIGLDFDNCSGIIFYTGEKQLSCKVEINGVTKVSALRKGQQVYELGNLIDPSKPRK